MADVVGQAEEKERRLNKSRKKLERKLVGSLEPGLTTILLFSLPYMPTPCPCFLLALHRPFQDLAHASRRYVTHKNTALSTSTAAVPKRLAGFVLLIYQRSFVHGSVKA